MEEEKEKVDNAHNLGQRLFYLCLTGVQTHMIDKDLNKLFRKFFQGRDIPIRGIMKKRGTNFAFLQFEDQEQRKEF